MIVDVNVHIMFAIFVCLVEQTRQICDPETTRCNAPKMNFLWALALYESPHKQPAYTDDEIVAV